MEQIFQITQVQLREVSFFAAPWPWANAKTIMYFHGRMTEKRLWAGIPPSQNKWQQRFFVKKKHIRQKKLWASNIYRSNFSMCVVRSFWQEILRSAARLVRAA
jgi:hypothetical protein